MAEAKVVTIIPAKKKAGNNITEEEEPKLRVAAYCRVSTETEEQASSYEAQVEHYTEYITKRDDWELAGIFADEGISGTATKKREGFNNMIKECMAGKIDMIITKSISRFARNTLDCLKYIRQLKEKNIPVYFEKENINTLDSKGEVLITIMASLAQQESQSLSQNVKLGYQYRFQQGKVSVNHNRFMGYTKDDEGNLVIVPEEAAIVRRIFREYLDGASLKMIGDGLEADGILTGAGKKRWGGDTIKKMLENEKYMGDALLQKTYTIDFLNKTRVKNDGIVPQYYVENDHEAIVSRETFMEVQKEIYRRSHLYNNKGKRRQYSCANVLCTRVFCSKCGDIFLRHPYYYNGKKHYVWRCATRIDDGPWACSAPTINEDELQQCIMRGINYAIANPDMLKEGLFTNIESSISCTSGDMTIVEIDDRLQELQKELLAAAAKKENYDKIANEIYALRNKKAKIQSDQDQIKQNKKRLSEMEKFLDENEDVTYEFDEKLVRKLIEKIVVYPEKIDITFKSGATTTVRR